MLLDFTILYSLSFGRNKASMKKKQKNKNKNKKKNNNNKKKLIKQQKQKQHFYVLIARTVPVRPPLSIVHFPLAPQEHHWLVSILV